MSKLTKQVIAFILWIVIVVSMVVGILLLFPTSNNKQQQATTSNIDHFIYVKDTEVKGGDKVSFQKISFNVDVNWETEQYRTVDLEYESSDTRKYELINDKWQKIKTDSVNGKISSHISVIQSTIEPFDIQTANDIQTAINDAITMTIHINTKYIFHNQVWMKLDKLERNDNE